jgi:hypothetical protein
LQICSAKPCDPVPANILAADMFELVTPKGFLWSGEDNTSPQIKKVTGKNVDEYKQGYFTEAIATVFVFVLVFGSLTFCSFSE